MSTKTSSALSGDVLLREFALRSTKGVQIIVSKGGDFTARPLIAEGEPDLMVQPKTLPPVPSYLLDIACHLLRHIQRVRDARALLLLCYHPGKNQWSIECPPQWCSNGTIDVDLSFKNCQPPDPESWMAGSVQNFLPNAFDDRSAIEAVLPRHDGVHFLLDANDQTASITAYMRCEAAFALLQIEQCVVPTIYPGLEHLFNRLMFRIPVKS